MLLAPLITDGYKTGHITQFPKKTQYLYSNFTARSSRIAGIDKVMSFNMQYFIERYLIDIFDTNFFELPREEAINEYQETLDCYLGKGVVNSDHIGALHDLGYLPLVIKALPEGTLCPIRIPLLTIKNTNPDFYWLTNYVETMMSNVLWHPITSATIAYQYKKILKKYENQTSDMAGFSDWQGHDFSMRGQTSIESSCVSGGAHLLSFTGTDTIPAIKWLEHYYNADAKKELVGGSVPATEHAIMCMGGKETEYETYKRLITEVVPKGIISVVSDTWDYWKVLTETIPSLKTEILARDGKVVVRPDSGDPVEIVCGVNICEYNSIEEAKASNTRDGIAKIGGKYYQLSSVEKDTDLGDGTFIRNIEYLDPIEIELTARHKGTIQTLWETFGGTINSKGYKQLDPHIGCIYGDSITLDRCKQICQRLKEKGFASTNMVYGIGSFTYQYVTRDTFGFAVKATWGVIDGNPINIFKDPKTDNGIKKSAKGLLQVYRDDKGELCLKQECTPEEEQGGLLETIFLDGKLIKETSLAEIRNRVNENLAKDLANG